MAHAGHFMCAEKEAKTQRKRNFLCVAILLYAMTPHIVVFLELLLWIEITNEKKNCFLAEWAVFIMEGCQT